MPLLKTKHQPNPIAANNVRGTTTNHDTCLSGKNSLQFHFGIHSGREMFYPHFYLVAIVPDYPTN